MLIPLREADVIRCGAKAAGLGVLTRAGLPVPDGVVVPVEVLRAAAHGPLPDAVVGELARALAVLGPVAVRSSASDEDGATASAAGQHESVLAVGSLDELVAAVRTCWASLHSPRAVAYRAAAGRAREDARLPRETEPAMAVLVQRHVDADVSGVMFSPTTPGGVTRIEASWGLGPSVVGGTVTPDAYDVAADGAVASVVADKRSRLDRTGARLVVSDVSPRDRARPSLDDATVRRLARLGHDVVAALDGAQDVEWAIAGGHAWVLQARPVTAPLPPASAGHVGSDAGVLVGTAGSRGTATGPARVVRGPADFALVQRGDVLVCPWTDPAWTPLLGVAAAVVTETGGALSHAAIVARERRIPAVLGVPDATTRLAGAARVRVDGTAGTVTMLD